MVLEPEGSDESDKSDGSDESDGSIADEYKSISILVSIQVIDEVLC